MVLKASSQDAHVIQGEGRFSGKFGTHVSRHLSNTCPNHYLQAVLFSHCALAGNGLCFKDRTGFWERPMNVLARVMKVALDEGNKPEGYVKGDEFHRFVRERLFPKESYDLLFKTHNYAENRDDFIESTKMPD